MVDDDVAVADRIVKDALSARRVDVVVGAQDERAGGWGEDLGQLMAVFVEVWSRDVLAAPDEDLVLPARRRALGSLCERRRIVSMVRR